MVSLYILDTKFLDDDVIFQSFLHNVSDFRKEKIIHFTFRKDKNLCLGASILLDKKLKELGLSEKDAIYSLSESGKPYFRNVPDLHFSISHSGDYSIVAFSSLEIGCDIEKITEVEDSVKKLCLSENEQKTIKTNRDFFFLWSVKESYLKAIGTGLTDSLDKIETATIEKDFYIQKIDSVDNYSIVVCHRERQQIVSPVLVEIP